MDERWYWLLKQIIWCKLLINASPGVLWRRSVESKPGLLRAADINSMAGHYSALYQLVHPLFVQSLTITKPQQIAQYELFQTFDPGITKSWNLLCCQQESFGVTSPGWCCAASRRWDEMRNSNQKSTILRSSQSRVSVQNKQADTTPQWPASLIVWWWLINILASHSLVSVIMGAAITSQHW